MKKLNKNITRLAVAALIILSSCTGNKKVKIAFNPELNKNYVMNYSTEMKMGMTMMGKTMDIKMNMGVESGLMATKSSAENKHLAFTYNAMSFDMGQGGMNMRYDSKSPSTDSSPVTMIMSKMFNSLINKKIEFDMSPKGEITNVTGYDVIIKEMMASVDSIPGSAAQMEGMKNQFGENQIKQMMSQGFNFYSEKEVGEGDEWETSSNLNMDYMKFTMKNKYKMLSMDGNVAKISLNGTMATGGETNSNEMQVNVDIKGTITGTLDVDIKTGMPISSNMKMDLKGSSAAGGQTIPMTMVGNIKLNTK